MFNNAGLSFDAAPPIKVVLRFFLTGAIFGVAASIFSFFNVESLNNSVSANTLTVVHLLTLGVMASFMLGALFQMLPVLAGVSINRAEVVSMRVNYALIFGTISLVVSFFNGAFILYLLAAILLSYALFTAAYVMLKELIKVKKTTSPKGMMLALGSLVVVLFLALLMLALRAGYNLPLNYIDIKNIHLSYALFGWIAMLIISVAFQVIEMFYVTPPYPKIMQNYLTITISILLLFTIVFTKAIPFIQTLIALILAAFATYTLIRLSQKKRSVSDATIWFWRAGMSSLLLFSILYILSNFINISIYLISLTYTFFAISIVFAMVFKIVPFLVWFQLNRAGYFDGPMMHEVIHPKIAKYNFYLFLASFITLIIGSFISMFIYIGALLLALTFVMLAILIYKAWHKYLYTLQFGTKIDFPSIM